MSSSSLGILTIRPNAALLRGQLDLGFFYVCNLAMNDFLLNFKACLIQGNIPTAATKIQFRPNQINKFDTFVAVNHYTYKGLDSISQALSLGAAGLVVGFDFDVGSLKCNDMIFIIQVEDTREFVKKAAQWRRKQLQSKIIGITGSLGKSTTTHVLNAYFSRFSKTAFTQGNFNNFWGLCDLVLNSPQNLDWIFFEIGAQKKNEIFELFQLLMPDYILLLNYKNIHSKTFENVMQAKLECIKAAPNAEIIIHDSFLPAIHLPNSATHFAYTNKITINGYESESLTLDLRMDTAAQDSAAALSAVCDHLNLPLTNLDLAKLYDFPRLPLFDLACTSGEALANFFKKVITLQGHCDPKALSIFISGISDDEYLALSAREQSHLNEIFIHLQKVVQIKRLFLLGDNAYLRNLRPLVTISFEDIDSPAQWGGSVEKDLKDVVVQDCRSQWLAAIAKKFSRTDLISRYLPPF